MLVILLQTYQPDLPAAIWTQGLSIIDGARGNPRLGLSPPFTEACTHKTFQTLHVTGGTLRGFMPG